MQKPPRVRCRYAEKQQNIFVYVGTGTTSCNGTDATVDNIPDLGFETDPERHRTAPGWELVEHLEDPRT